MRPYVQLRARASLSMGLFFSLSLLGGGVASAAGSIPVHVYSALEAKMITSSRVQTEQQNPRGSLIYYVDQYEIDDGPNSLTLNIDTTFKRQPNGMLYATDIDTGYTWTFSRKATVERKNNVSEIIVRPGGNPDVSLQRLILLGGARLVRVIPGARSTAALQPACPLGQMRHINTVCGPPPPRWMGGGLGSANGAMRSISNSCVLRGKSIVSFSYTVLNTPGPVATSFCAFVGGTVEPCYFFQNDSPGSSHNRSITYNDGGDVGASLGFHSASYENNGAGSGQAPGCDYASGCS